MFYKDAALFQFFTDAGPLKQLDVSITTDLNEKELKLKTDPNGFLRI
jgi:hypothetical protein